MNRLSSHIIITNNHFVWCFLSHLLTLYCVVYFCIILCCNLVFCLLYCNEHSLLVSSCMVMWISVTLCYLGWLQCQSEGNRLSHCRRLTSRLLWTFCSGCLTALNQSYWRRLIFFVLYFYLVFQCIRGIIYFHRYNFQGLKLLKA